MIAFERKPILAPALLVAARVSLLRMRRVGGPPHARAA
jgi:hypothetical protein